MGRLLRNIFIAAGITLALLGAAFPAQALDYLQIDAGLLLIGNTEPESAPSPLLPTFGVTLPVLQRRLLYWETGVLLFGTYYQYENNRATPVELEHRDFFVLGILADSRWGLRTRLGPYITVGGAAGVALLLRIPIPLFSDIRRYSGPTLAYFYAGRFLYPETELFVQAAILENLDLKLSLRAYYPIFHLWDGEQLPFGDQFLVGFLVGFVLPLGD